MFCQDIMIQKEATQIEWRSPFVQRKFQLSFKAWGQNLSLSFSWNVKDWKEWMEERLNGFSLVFNCTCLPFLCFDPFHWKNNRNDISNYNNDDDDYDNDDGDDNDGGHSGNNNDDSNYDDHYNNSNVDEINSNYEDDINNNNSSSNNDSASNDDVNNDNNYHYMMTTTAATTTTATTTTTTATAATSAKNQHSVLFSFVSQSFYLSKGMSDQIILAAGCFTSPWQSDSNQLNN